MSAGLHPQAPRTKQYVRPMPATWWLANRHLVLFMIRELTSVFIAAYAVFLLFLLWRTNHQANPADARIFAEDVLGSPWMVAFHVVVLAFAVYHSVTWFNLTPKALILWRGEERVPGPVIAGAHYLLWLLASLGVLLYILSW